MFPRHLVRALEINWILAMSDKNICSAVFNWHGHRNGHGYGNGQETDTEMDTETDMEMDTDMDKDTDMELEYFC